MDLNKRLKSMLNKPWMLDSAVHRFENFSITNGKSTIVTDRRTISIETNKLGEFLRQCLPVEETLTPDIISQSRELIEQSRTTIHDMQKVLSDNVSKLQQDPKYIQQAKEVTKTVNSMISLHRLQLEYLKEMKKA